MTFHNTWYNWYWTETILENISHFLSLIHPTEQFLEILFATGSYYVVHPRLALNVDPSTSVSSIVTTGVPALAFPMNLTEQFVSLQFTGLKKQKQRRKSRTRENSVMQTRLLPKLTRRPEDNFRRMERTRQSTQDLKSTPGSGITYFRSPEASQALIVHRP